MTLVSAEDSNNNSVDVLVITDHFNKLAHAFSCQDQTAKRAARKLWDNFFCIYGFPQHLHSDQGAKFQSELIAVGGPVPSLTIQWGMVVQKGLTAPQTTC